MEATIVGLLVTLPVITAAVYSRMKAAVIARSERKSRNGEAIQI